MTTMNIMTKTLAANDSSMKMNCLEDTCDARNA